MEENTIKKHKKHSFRSLIGLAGISQNEPLRVQYIGVYLEWLKLVIVIWLPFQWYFRTQHIINGSIVMLDNWIIWAVFVTETIVMTSFVRNKINYLLTNWLNLLIITFGFPPLLKLFPIIIDFQIIFLLVIIAIIIPWLSTARKFLLRNHLGATLIVFIVVTILAGLIITFAEATITNPMEGIWWAFQTVTTIGYGDVIPQTFLGRTVAVVVMLIGIGLFSLLIANFSSFLLERDEEKQCRELKEIRKKLDEISSKFDKL